MSEEPRKPGLVWPLVLAFALGMPIITALLLIGNDGKERAERIDKNATILTIGAAVSLVVISSSFPIRQWRRGEEKPETVREIVKDGTQKVKEIHYGAPPKYELGREPTVSPWAYPAMMTAAYKAGVTGSQQQSATALQREEWNWQEELPEAARDGKDDVPPPAGWDGEIVM